MQSIPPALAGLANYPQFILFLLEPSKTKPGKNDKFPIDWRTGRKCSIHDTSAWMSFNDAIAQLAAGRGHGVGFVFSEHDPFFFLDIDNALQSDGQWAPHARMLCGAFPGAAVEVSSSGKGLHIIGSGAVAVGAEHGCKHQALGLEFYTQWRFVALTGAHASGDVNADMSNVLPWLVQNYFPASAAGDKDGEWTTEPREDWRGPTDDDDLLRRALQSKSAAAIFGGNKATFADLWDRNVDVLAVAYPHSDRPFDESDADAALSSHLAFWTGCNMERMERLIRQSALVREKWDHRRPVYGSWIGLTIARAVGVQKDVCRDKEVAPALPPIEQSGTVKLVVGETKESQTFLHPAQQLELFAGCAYVIDSHRVFVPALGSLLRPDQFKTVFGGHVFVMDKSNEKTTRNAWEAFTESNVNVCPKVDLACFRPELQPGAIVTHEGRRFVNTYVPIDIPRASGSIEPFLAHLQKILPVERDRAILLAYMAAIVQHKGVKFQWAPLLQGTPGNGKTLFSRCVAYAVGERYTHWPRADKIHKQFNRWLYGNIFIGIEDVYLQDHQTEVIEIIKPMITSDKLEIEPKGVDAYVVQVCCNWILNSNHKDAIRKTRDDRRFACFYTAQQNREDALRDGMGGDYFPKLYDWLKAGGYAAVAEFLYTYAIPDEFNPATHCQFAPSTSSTVEAIEASMGGVEQEVVEAIGAGTPGFQGGWISSLALNRLLEKINRSRSLTHNKRTQMLRDMGYVKHPSLHDGRVNNIVLPDASKPILFIRTDSPDLHLQTPAEVARAYSLAQGVAFG